jgi:hypothetical protein
MPYHPINRGFDEFYGFLGHGAHDYFDLKRQPEDFQSIWRNDKVIDDSGYLTDNLGREAVNFVRNTGTGLSSSTWLSTPCIRPSRRPSRRSANTTRAGETGTFIWPCWSTRIAP